MSVDSLGITVDRRDSVSLWASRNEGVACLVFDTDGTHCEIQLDRVAVEALRDQLPATLAGLDRWVAEDTGCGEALRAEQRAVDATARALDLAAAADEAGAHEVAASLREAAATAVAASTAVNAAVGAYEGAAVEADYAAQKLSNLTGEAAVALRRLTTVPELRTGVA